MFQNRDQQELGSIAQKNDNPDAQFAFDQPPAKTQNNQVTKHRPKYIRGLSKVVLNYSER